MNSTSGGKTGGPGSSSHPATFFGPEPSRASNPGGPAPSVAAVADPDDAVPTLDLSLEDEAPASASTPASNVWPATVPSAQMAQALLQDPEAGGTLGDVSRALLAEASEPEKMLLAIDEVPEELRLLKAALLQRWRLAAANALAPSEDVKQPIDRVAFEALLSETDALLQSLGATQGLSDAMRESLSSAREHLARELVTLTERVPAEGVVPEVAPVAPAAPSTAKTARTSNTRLVSIEKGSATPARRMTALHWALVVSLVLGGAFHGIRFALRPTPTDNETPTGWPPGTLHMHPKRVSGPRVDSFVVPYGAQVAPATLSALRDDAAAQGLEVVQLSPQTYVVRPAEQRKNGDTK